MTKPGVWKKSVCLLVMIWMLATTITIPVKAEEANPFQPHILMGYCYYMSPGAGNEAKNATVLIINEDTGENGTVKTDANGYYYVDLGFGMGGWGWDAGENITVIVMGNATEGYDGWTGRAQGTVPAVMDWINITLKPPDWGGLNESFTDTTFPPSGWTRWNLGDDPTGVTWERTTTYYHTPPAGAYCNYGAAGEAQDEWLITPKLTPTSSNYNLTFWYKTHSSFAATVYVKVSNTTLNPAEFDDTVLTLGNQPTWTQYTVDLSNYIGEEIWVAFEYVGTYDWYAAIDDVQGPPLVLPANDVGVVAINEPSQASYYEQGTDVTINVTVKNFGENCQEHIPVTVRVINIQTGSTVYEETKYTGLIGKLQTEDVIFTWTANTACLHYIEAWTSLPGDENNTNDASPDIRYVSIYKQGGLYESFEGTTYPPIYWTSINTSQGSYSLNGAHSAYFSYSSSANERILITPRMDVESGDIFAFWLMKAYTSYSGEFFRVEYTTDGTTWTEMLNLTSSDLNAMTNYVWYYYSFDLTSLAGQTIQIRFFYNPEGGSSIWIEDVKGAVLAPYHNAKVISINAPVDGPAGWQTPNATVENIGTVTETFNVSFKIYKMTGGGYFIDEDFSAGVPPPGWSQEEAGEWDQSSTNYAGGTAPEADLYWWNIWGDYAYLDSPAVDTSSASTLYLEFKSWIDDYSGGYNCTVYVRKDATDTWHDITPWTNPISGDVGPDTYLIDITPYIGTGTQVRFEFDGDAYSINDWYLDDVKIYEPPVYSLVYEDNETVTLDVGEETDVLFDPWLATSGNYLANVTAWVTDDYDPTNNYMEKTFTILVDTIPPEITNVQANPASQTNLPPNWVNITCEVTDNLAVDEVWVNITYPDSTYHNFTMQEGSYYFNQTYTQVGTYNFYIWAVDIEGNSNKSTGHSFEILPNNPPDAPTNPNPADGATDVSVNTMLSVDVSDPDGDLLDVYFYWGNGTLIGMVPDVASGGTASIGPLSLDYNTTYEWYAVADDTMYQTTSPTWQFTTEAAPPPPQYYYEGFETWPPDGWTIVVYSGEGTWEQEAYGVDSYEPPGTGNYYAEADSNEHSSYTFDCGLFTPRLDCTGLTNVSITYARNYQNFAGYDNAGVRIYSGGMDPANLQEVIWWSDTDDPSDGVIATHYFDPSGYPDPSCVYVEFYYTTNGYTWCWKFSIDDVNISAPLYQAAHDVGVKSINYPLDGGTYPEGDITVNATVKNYGTNTETFVVNCTVTKVMKNRGILFYEDFEPPVTGWTRINTSTEVADGVPSNWILPPDYDTSSYAHTGNYGAYCHYGYIPDSQDEWLISPVIDLTTATDPYLSFWWETSYYWEADPYDNYDVTVLVTTDGGATWTEIWNTSALPSYSSWTWYDTTLGTHISLASYIGEQIQLAWRFKGGDSADFGLDDIVVYDLEMEMVYYNEQTVTNLAPGEERYVEFTPPWSAIPGEYIINVTTKLAGDMNPDNDEKTAHVTIVGISDVGVQSINYPHEGDVINATDIVVNATVKNYGTIPAKERGIEIGITKESKEAPATKTKAFDVKLTVYRRGAPCLLYENFTAGVPPPGWSQEEAGEWDQSSTNYAGGTAPEARLYWDNINGDYAYLDSPAVDTSSASTLYLEFKSYIDHYTDIFNCTVYVRKDATDTWHDITPWTNPISGDVGPDTYLIDITPYIGTGTQVRFEFDGYYWNINYWYIDDVGIYAGLPPAIVYEDTKTVPTLNPGETYDVEFDPWPATEGNYTIVVETLLPGDMNASNDVKMINVTITPPIAKDAGVESINYPTPGTYPPDDYIVNATVKNYGITTETFNVNCSIWKEINISVADWVHYDGDNANAIGFTSPTTWEAAIRLTPTELAPYDGAQLTVVRWHQGFEGSPDTDVYYPTVKIYAGGTSDHPGPLIYSETFGPTSGTGWYNFTLSTPITIDASQDLWISIEVDDPGSGYYPQGVDAGPAVPGKGDWLSYDGGVTWYELLDYGYSYNWNIRVFVEGAGTTYELVYYDEQTVTNLAPGEERYVEFAPWTATFGDYIINVRTLLPGDINPANDEKEVNVTIYQNLPPSTSCFVGGSKGKNGWYVSGVTISFFAFDPEGRGINATYYRIGEREWQLYTGGIINIGMEGIFTIQFYSEDIDGLIEDVKTKTIKIAMSKPYTICQLDGLMGENDWYISNVTVSFIRGGSPAGIAYTKYRLDGGEWQIYDNPFIVEEEGQHTIDFYSEDMAGNVGDTGSASFKIDKLSPQVQVIYPNGGEELSGVITIEWEANDTVDDSLEVSLYYSSDGLNWNAIAEGIENTGSYEWDTEGIAPGDYWIKVVARDDAGHVTEDTSDEPFTILPTLPLSVEITKPGNYLYVMDRAIIRLPMPVIIGGITIEVAVEGRANKIELQIDNEIKYESNGEHTTYSWYYDEPIIGMHEIKTIAYDSKEKAMASIKAFFLNLL